jgi:hypothetical protein
LSGIVNLAPKATLPILVSTSLRLTERLLTIYTGRLKLFLSLASLLWRKLWQKRPRRKVRLRCFRQSPVYPLLLMILPLDKENQLKGLKKKKGDLNARREHLEAALIELNALDATFADLIGRLTTMETIWRMVR